MPERIVMRADVRIGTSGWQYGHWAGTSYPRNLARDRWLEHYATEFDTVEVNSPFYRLPPADVFGGWSRRVPHTFRFAVKASRYLTHTRRLREPKEALDRFWTRAWHLGPRLGPVLYQLPPHWKPNMDRLQAFLDALPRAEQAIEFRDSRWYGSRTSGALAEAKVALCLHDMPGSTPEFAPAGPFAYVRFHGYGDRYGGRYSSQRLSAWADRVAHWSSLGMPTWAYFNNDLGGHAVRDASRLRTMVARRGAG